MLVNRNVGGLATPARTTDETSLNAFTTLCIACSIGQIKILMVSFLQFQLVKKGVSSHYRFRKSVDDGHKPLC